MGVYRTRRDVGEGLGAILTELSMEFVSIEVGLSMTAMLMFFSGAVDHRWIGESPPDVGTHEPPAPTGEPIEPGIPGP